MSDQTMAGRTVLVTGASDGIGAETARALAARGATVHVTGRSADKLRPVADAVGTEPLVADFSRLDDVRRLAEQVRERVDTLDVLLNNAGGTFAPSRKTHDGHEPNFQINHLAPFLLTRGIASRWSDDGVVSAAVHPGPVGSSFGRDSWLVGLLYRSPLKRLGTITVPEGSEPLIDGLWERSAALTGLA